MKKVINRNSTSTILSISLALLLTFSTALFAQNSGTDTSLGDPVEGKALFNSNCAACHDLEKRLVGPPLSGVSKKHEREWLYKWINNSQELIAEGDPQAVALWEEFLIPMLPFPNLTTKDIDNILAYIDPPPSSSEPVSNASTQDDSASDGGGTGDKVNGKSLFNSNCAACHALNAKRTGPALANVGGKYERDWLYKWINNSQKLIKEGDPIAVALWDEYQPSVMNAFPQLTTEDIDDILAYTDAPPVLVDPGPNPIPVQPASSGISNEIILGALALVFGILVVMLFLVNKTLRRIAEANGVQVVAEESEKRTPIWKAFAQNQFLVLVTVIFLMLSGAYFGYGYLMQVGVDQGYSPIQPIHYSHKIHAGDNQIDCKYCHSSARVSKHSGIPSLNVCMNCHKSISEYSGEEDLANGYTKEFYTKEIKKLYDAVGWDEDTRKYTGEAEPVKWVRIHNLPDFAYFNHSQHVTVAGVECQKCHGPVEEMEIMEQFAPLTMGWCINCHRETNVNLEGNEYYEKIHEELSKKYDVDKLTAAQMGGLECGKCHY